MASFDVETFVKDMREIAVGTNAPKALRAYIDAVMETPDAVQAAFPADMTGDIILYEDDTVSVWRTSFEPGVSVPAHDHQMSAVISVYQGRERNDFLSPTQTADCVAAKRLCWKLAVCCPSDRAPFIPYPVSRTNRHWVCMCILAT